MSKIALSGNASGTGTLTLSAPNTNSDRTINLPDAAGTVFVSGQALTATTGSFSGDVTLGSSVLATPSGSAPSYTCRAWVNFNGTGTVAIRASGNVSSITDNGTGDYTVNFTTAMPDANYAVSGACGEVSGTEAMGVDSRATSSLTVFTYQTETGGNKDCGLVCASIFR
jgi:hypothetical protein